MASFLAQVCSSAELRRIPYHRAHGVDHPIPPMKPEERERMYELCALIEKEQDHHRFLELIEELNDLLERKERRMEDKPSSSK